ncbi:CpaD family pilus assembly lipoprotein [Sphingomonas pituitosa]|uniref:CpaD family pilus assembly lipoprotein n=1 Tax=Sphingomonas pituitosa TaxID=99597 RepID=UPI000831120F|nr:CpaD family pilus assembly lipoprotein [Sphingomonas pituitosa]
MFPRPALALLAPALLLAGCAGYNGSLDSVHQPIVARQDLTLDLQADGGRLAPGEDRRLAEWMGAMNLRYGDRLAIDDGGEGSTGRAEVAAAAGRYGLMLADRAPATGRPNTPDIVRVVLTRTTANVPGCPDYAHPSGMTADASTSSNFGCATASNLAAMVADPADLVRGAPGSPTADPMTMTKAIGAYRAALPSGAGGTTVKADSAGGPK